MNTPNCVLLILFFSFFSSISKPTLSKFIKSHKGGINQQIDRDAKKLNSALSELKEEAKKQTHLGKQAPFIVLDDAPITTPAPRPTDKDIERIRYELDRAVTIAEQVVKQSPLVAPTQPLFQVAAATLLESVSHAHTEFNAVYPKEE